MAEPPLNGYRSQRTNRRVISDRTQRLSRPRLLRPGHPAHGRTAKRHDTRPVAVKPGAFSDEPIGPHPISQFSVIFETQEFRNVVPWLMLNREGLDVLVHPLTESSYDDHSKNALWLGTPVPMRLEILRPTYRT